MWRRDPLVPDAERRWARSVTVGSTALFALVLCRWRPWTLFERGGFTTDFYDAQADAFWHLRLDVPAEVAGIEGFSIDGKTYLYYGPFLAVARMPLALFGTFTDGRLTRLSMVLAFVALCTLGFHLVRRLDALVEAPPGAPWRPALLIAALAASPVLALAGRASVYHETELWALVFIVATFVALLDVLREPSARAVALAAAAALAAVMTRASIGFGALAALAITGAWLLAAQRQHRRLSFAAIGTAVAGVGAYAALNLAKFGTPFDLPAERQVLTLLSPERAAWFAGNGGSFFGLGFLPTTIVQYVRPDAIRFERLIPFVRFGPPAHEFGSYPLEGNTPASSLVSTATLLVVMALIGLVLFVRGRHWRLTPLLAGAVVAAVPTLAIGFVANRYLVDLLPLLVVPAALAAARWHLVARRTTAIIAVIALLVWGAVANTALAAWQDGIDRPGFTAARYEFDGLLFDDPPPSVIDLDPTDPVPRDGVVGIDGDCDGLYIASQGVWVPLEQAVGVRRLLAEFDPADGPGGLANERGDAITIGIAPDGVGLFVLYEAAGAAAAQGSVANWDGGPVDVEVTADPVAGGVTGGLSVQVDGEQALFALAVPDLATMTASGGLGLAPADDRETPICDDLADRR